MISTLLIVLPIFGLIFAGFACRRFGLLGPNASPELNRFVVYLALPALLFDVMAHTHWQAIYQPGFLIAFCAGCAVIYVATLILSLRGRRHLADAGIDGLNASYSNAGFMGFPLCMAVLGNSSLVFVSIAMIITVVVQFGLTIIVIEIGQQMDQGKIRYGRLFAKVSGALLRHPLVISPLAGSVWAATGLDLPVSLEAFLKLMAGAASPCALVALGLFLAEKRTPKAASASATGSAPTASPVSRHAQPVRAIADNDGQIATALVGAKLLLQPALTWFIAVRLLDLPPATSIAAVLLAALPTGTGPFMLAEFYAREAIVTSRTILWSTIGSVLTVTVYLHFANALAG